MDAVLSLRMAEGAYGYGLYCMLLELMRESSEHCLNDNPKNLAFALQEPDAERVERVIHNYDLFQISSDGVVRSNYLEQVLQEFEDKKAAAREAGKKGAAIRYGKTSPIAEKNDPMGGGMATLYDTMPTNQPTKEVKPKEEKPTKSKLAAMSFGDLSGDDLIRICRDQSRMDPLDVHRWATQWSDSDHNGNLLIRLSEKMQLSWEVWQLIAQITRKCEVGFNSTRKLVKILQNLDKGDFQPLYPADYVISKLLQPGNDL